MSEQRSWGVNFVIVEDEDGETVRTKFEVVGASSDMEQRGLLSIVEEHLRFMRRMRVEDMEEV
jgi:hypothetical protein